MKKLSGPNFYQINSASLEKIKIAATEAGRAKATRNPLDSTGRVNHEILKPGEAELWQIKEFLQHEQGIATNARGILHAEEIKEKSGDGSIIKKIRLYVRSKPDSRDEGFFSKFKYEAEQRRAAEVLASLAKAYQSTSTSPPAGRAENNALQRLITESASLDIKTIAICIQDVAFGIEAEKLKKNTDATEEYNRMREQLKGDLPRRANDEEIINANEAVENLKKFGFKPAEVRAFHKLVNNIIDGKGMTNYEDEYAIRKFQDQWLRRCERITDSGKKFRNFICKAPEYRRWNTVVHCLAKCTKLKFDFGAYKYKDYVMLPSIEDMDWSKAQRSEDATHDLMRKMHEEAGKNNTFECKNSARPGQKLFAAKSRDISLNQNTLKRQQQAYLAKMYSSITENRLESGSSWLLTPLFNYTENTIEQCIAPMLGPFKSALEAGKTSLEVDIFSADPRITDKFNEAWEKLKKETSRKRNATSANVSQSQLASNPVQEPMDAVSDCRPQSFLDTIHKSAVAAMETFKLGTTMPTYVMPAPSFAIPTLTMPTFGTPEVQEAADKKTASTDAARMPSLEMEGDIEERNGPHQSIGTYEEALVAAELQMKPKSADTKIKDRKRHIREVTIANPTSHKIAKIELQLGITEKDWKPDRTTVLLLTSSATSCLQPDQMILMSELSPLLNSREFGEFRDIGRIVKFVNSVPGSDDNRYIFASKEFFVNGGVWPVGSGKLDASKAGDIATTYKNVCEDAVAGKIQKLVATPCFSLPRSEMFASDKVYRDAVAVMIKTLHDCSLMHPQLQITSVARSESELAIMEEAILANRLAAN